MQEFWLILEISWGEFPSWLQIGESLREYTYTVAIDSQAIGIKIQFLRKPTVDIFLNLYIFLILWTSKMCCAETNSMLYWAAPRPKLQAKAGRECRCAQSYGLRQEKRVVNACVTKSTASDRQIGSWILVWLKLRLQTGKAGRECKCN